MTLPDKLNKDISTTLYRINTENEKKIKNFMI